MQYNDLPNILNAIRSARNNLIPLNFIPKRIIKISPSDLLENSFIVKSIKEKMSLSRPLFYNFPPGETNIQT